MIFLPSARILFPEHGNSLFQRLIQTKLRKMAHLPEIRILRHSHLGPILPKLLEYHLRPDILRKIRRHPHIDRLLLIPLLIRQVLHKFNALQRDDPCSHLQIQP